MAIRAAVMTASARARVAVHTPVFGALSVVTPWPMSGRFSIKTISSSSAWAAATASAPLPPSSAATATETTTTEPPKPLPANDLLSYMYNDALANARRDGGSVNSPRYLTSMPFLLGVNVKAALSSPAAAAAFLEHALPPRVPTLTSLSNSFFERMRLRENDEDNATERLNNPLSAVQSAPGGGKSALLDLITVLCHHSMWTPGLCSDAAMRDILNNSVTISVTYNSGSDTRPNLYDQDDDYGLALRILHSHFIDRKKLAFDVFFEAMVAAPGRITAANALRACLMDVQQQSGGKKRGVVLLVDEVAKLYEAKEKPTLMQVMGRLLDSFSSNELNCVVTAHNSAHVAEKAAPKRAIWWAPLPPVPRGDAKAAMLKALQAVQPTASELPRAVEFLISDTAGHPRSLQFAMQAMLELQPKGEHASLSALRQATLARLDGMYDAPDLPHVVAALKGKALPLDDVVSGTDQTLRSLIVTGVFLNTDVSGKVKEVVPKLSMLRLLQAHSESNPVFCSICTAVKELAEEEEAVFRELGSNLPPTRTALTGEPFERFMAVWMRLLTLVRNGEVVTPLELFNVSAAQKTAVRADSPLRARMKLTALADGVYTLEETLASSKKHGKLPRSASWVARFGGNNPAFDLLLTAPAADDGKGPVAVVVKTRISDVDAKTIDIADLSNEYISSSTQVQKQIAGATGRKGRPASVIYVYTAVCFMDQVKATQDAYLQKDVLVVSCEISPQHAPGTTVQDFFTPTLADRAFFLREAQLKDLMQQKEQQKQRATTAADSGTDRDVPAATGATW